MNLASYIFECSGCGAMHRSPEQHVPVGWSTCQGHAFCSECVGLGIPSRILAAEGVRKPNRKRAA